MRPLWLADPGSTRAAAQDQEWLLGPDVLVAPVVSAGARSRRCTSRAAAGSGPGATAPTTDP